MNCVASKKFKWKLGQKMYRIYFVFLVTNVELKIVGYIVCFIVSLLTIGLISKKGFRKKWEQWEIKRKYRLLSGEQKW